VTSVVTELKTESWHRSKPLQRCNTKTTELCKTLHHMTVSTISNWSPLQRRNYADPHFRAVGFNATLAFFLLDAFWLIASEFSLYRARCTPLSKARCDPLCHTHTGPVSHTIGAPGKQLPGAAITGRSHAARPCGAGREFGSADPIRRSMGAPLSTQMTARML
jgi:hypothetical protein